MQTTDFRPAAPLHPASRWYSKILAPGLILAAVVVAAGSMAGLGPVGVILLLAGIVGVPGVIYKGSKGLIRRRGLPDSLRTTLVAALMFVGAVACCALSLPAPVPSTVAALFVGNAGLVFFRRWLNVSAHVSVLTFAVLWATAVFGGAWTWLLILSPVMMVSRVSLRQHTWPEALSGAVLGLGAFCCFLLAMAWG